jgi:hypothetical protein
MARRISLDAMHVEVIRLSGKLLLAIVSTIILGLGPSGTHNPYFSVSPSSDLLSRFFCM